MRTTLASGGCRRGRAREAGQRGAAPGAHQHGEAAGVTAARPGQAGDEPAGGNGEQSGGCSRGRGGCDAGFAAERGDGMGASVHLGEGPGREGRRWSGSIAEPRVGSGGLRLVRSRSAAVSRRRLRAGPGRRRRQVPGWRVRAAGGAPGSGSAAVFLLRHVAGSVRSVTMPWALRSVLPGPAASRGAARPGRGPCTAATGRGRSGHSSSPP
jgi:hypothetical protein